MTSKQQQKIADKRVEKAYYAVASGIQINIMDIVKVFAKGRALIGDGADDEALKAGIKAFVETIRVN